jgi:hypothetical protein
MARLKEKVYQYDQEGKFIKEWSSQSSVRAYYYSDKRGKYPIFRNDLKGAARLRSGLSFLPDGTIVTRKKIGKTGVMIYMRRYNNPYVERCLRHSEHVDSIIEVYNLDNEKIAEFKDVDIASKMTGRSYSSIHSKVNSESHGRDGLKYKLIKI